jgi:asparagine synthase (glutamine-hydrolysing)
VVGRLAGQGNSQRLAKLSDMLESGLRLDHAYRVWRGLFTRPQVEKLLRPDFAKEVLQGLDSWEPPNGSRIKDLRKQISFLETTRYMANQLLRDTDAFSMAHSLEVRVPFVDHQLVELVAKIPPHHKLGGTIPKKLLVKALGSTLPGEITTRSKMGFTFPFDLWLKEELMEMVKECLLRSKALNSSSVEKLLSAFMRGRVHWSRVWALVVLGNWVG